MTIGLYSYKIIRKCRVCSNEWDEQVTKQRPW